MKNLSESLRESMGSNMTEIEEMTKSIDDSIVREKVILGGWGGTVDGRGTPSQPRLNWVKVQVAMVG